MINYNYLYFISLLWSLYFFAFSSLCTLHFHAWLLTPDASYKLAVYPSICPDKVESVADKVRLVSWFLLNTFIISVKVLLNLCKLLKIIREMHDLCKTKLYYFGYKDIKLLW